MDRSFEQALDALGRVAAEIDEVAASWENADRELVRDRRERRSTGLGAQQEPLESRCDMYTLGVALDDASHAEVRAAVADVEAAVRPHRAGHYPNFVEEPADASSFFPPATWARLRAIKARYDGGDLFAGNHHIPPAGRLAD